MTNAELIKALRCCASLDTSCKGLCSYHGVEYCLSKKDLDAADALEAAEAREKAWTQKCERLEKRIARLEEDLKTREAECEVMQDQYNALLEMMQEED